jgi:hypothetical protein
MSVFTNEVVGPLTDAELRATPVPVSATFTPSGTQDVNVVSTIPIPVTDNGGSLTVDGPLTDAQLRATAVPVSGTVSASVTNFPATSTGIATVTNIPVGTTVTTLSASNAAKLKVVIHNEAGTLFVKLGTGATASSYSYRLTANTITEITGYTGDITAIKASGSAAVLVTEIGI